MTPHSLIPRAALPLVLLALAACMSAPTDAASAARSSGLLAGEIVITEIMVNPAQPLHVPETKYEWLELFNASDRAIDLQGSKLSDASTKPAHAITAPLIVPAGSYVVLASSDGTSFDNGGVPVDYAYGSALSLANGGDAIVLTDAAGTLVDRVDFRTSASGNDFHGAYASGVSMSLSADALDASKNDDPRAWCKSMRAFVPAKASRIRTIGSPRLPNEPCRAMPRANDEGAGGGPATDAADDSGRAGGAGANADASDEGTAGSPTGSGSLDNVGQASAGSENTSSGDMTVPRHAGGAGPVTDDAPGGTTTTGGGCDVGARRGQPAANLVIVLFGLAALTSRRSSRAKRSREGA